MGLTLNYASPPISVIGGDDLDPNATPPDAATRIFNAGRSTEVGGRTVGVLVTFDFTDPIATADITVWFQDEKSKKWFRAKKATGLTDKESFELLGFSSADHFFQLTGMTGTGTVVLRAEPTS